MANCSSFLWFRSAGLGPWCLGDRYRLVRHLITLVRGRDPCGQPSFDLPRRLRRQPSSAHAASGPADREPAARHADRRTCGPRTRTGPDCGTELMDPTEAHRHRRTRADPGSAEPGGPATTAVVVSLAPLVSVVAPGGAVAFTASVTGSPDTRVAWSVQEGAAGGSVTASGLYSAPAAEGTFHVVAASHADASRSRSATVTVRAATRSRIRHRHSVIQLRRMPARRSPSPRRSRARRTRASPGR